MSTLKGITSIVNSLDDNSTVKALSALKGKELNERVVILENAVPFAGCYLEVDPDFEPILIPENFKLCNGDIITSSLSLFVNRRTPNLSGATITIPATAASGVNVININPNDIFALNIGDPVTGTGIPANSVISSKTSSSITRANINGSWTGTNYANVNTTAIVTSITVTGNTFDLSSDSLEWDLMQGHWHELFYWTSRGSDGLNWKTIELNNTNFLSNNAVKNPVSDGTNNTPRTSNKTKQRTRKIEYYIRIY